jgi:hypothetical protein
VLITKYSGKKENDIIKDREFRTNESGHITGCINLGVQNIWTYFKEIPGDHACEGLPPVMDSFKGRISDADKTNEKINNDPECHGPRSKPDII